MPKLGSQKISYRCDVMNGEIKYGELECWNPVVSMDSEIDSSETDIKYSSSFSTSGYIWRQGKKTNELMDWVKYRYRIIAIINGEENSLGVFLPQTYEQITDATIPYYNVTGYDKSVLAKNDCITSRLSLASGTYYINQITSLLISCGITNVIADASTAALQTTREDWDIGTSKLKIVNQLLSEISFRSVTMDANGAALLKRYEAANAGNIKHTYRQGTASIISRNTTVKSNIIEIPNIWTATISNADLDTDLTYTYTNDNPLNKTSTVYTGQNKVKVLTFDNIATQTDLENAVKKQAFNDMQGIETITFSTEIVADHGANETVALYLDQFSGIIEETAWEINLDQHTMTHTGRRAVNYG